MIVGVIDKQHLGVLFEAYPFWKQIVARLNRSIHSLAKKHLEKYLSKVGVENTYIN